MRDFKAAPKKLKPPIFLKFRRWSLSVKAAVKRLAAKKWLRHKKGANPSDLDTRRRAFLKYAFFGGAVFVAGKYVNPLINAIRGDTVLSERTFENFKITETGRKLLVTDDDGGEILTIDKESF